MMSSEGDITHIATDSQNKQNYPSFWFFLCCAIAQYKQAMVDPAIPPVEDSALPREQLVQKLTQKLVLRPDKGDLVEQNILKGNQFPLMQGLMFQDEKLSPMLQATSEALKKGQLADNLQKKIHHRPDKDDLVQQNILKGSLEIVFLK